jgi:hypothetical protein
LRNLKIIVFVQNSSIFIFSIATRFEIIMRKHISPFAMFFFTTALFGAIANAQQPLLGIEVIGNKKISREFVLAGFPTRVGDAFGPDFESVHTWCGKLKERLDVAYAGCSMVGYSGGRIYAVIDLVEKEDRAKLLIADVAERRDIWLDATLCALSQKISALLVEKTKNNISVKQSTNNFLDFEDADLRVLANELFQRAPPRRQEIFDVLQHAKDEKQRIAAANLLRWCGDPTAGVAVAVRSIRDDSDGVRNNLVQFISFFFDYAKPSDVEFLIKDLAWQLGMPYHTDRNKALGVISEIMQARPDLKKSINSEAGEQIAYLATHSILPNVGGLASKLLIELHAE